MEGNLILHFKCIQSAGPKNPSKLNNILHSVNEPFWNDVKRVHLAVSAPKLQLYLNKQKTRFKASVQMNFLPITSVSC